jgi:hypothetical protein
MRIAMRRTARIAALRVLKSWGSMLKNVPPYACFD